MITGLFPQQPFAGYAVTCAVLTGGQARCWGDNHYGGLGDGTTTASDRPVTVSGIDGTGPLTDVADIGAGTGQTCARLTTGQARCWGIHGGIGNGTTGGLQTTPVVVLNPDGTGPLTRIVAISVVNATTCAALEGGQARCWGYNDEGQVGDATRTDRLLPVTVVEPAATP